MPANTTIELYDILGKKIYQSKLNVNSTTELNITEQPTGIYLYRVLTETGGLISTGKLVIQK